MVVLTFSFLATRVQNSTNFQEAKRSIQIITLSAKMLLVTKAVITNTKNSPWCAVMNMKGRITPLIEAHIAPNVMIRQRS